MKTGRQDVYKRQIPGNRQGVFKASGPFPVPRVQDNVEAQARRQVKVLFQQVLPVSYTHLDVYKRQIIYSINFFLSYYSH